MCEVLPVIASRYGWSATDLYSIRMGRDQDLSVLVTTFSDVGSAHVVMADPRVVLWCSPARLGFRKNLSQASVTVLENVRTLRDYWNNKNLKLNMNLII